MILESGQLIFMMLEHLFYNTDKELLTVQVVLLAQEFMNFLKGWVIRTAFNSVLDQLNTIQPYICKLLSHSKNEPTEKDNSAIIIDFAYFNFRIPRTFEDIMEYYVLRESEWI